MMIRLSMARIDFQSATYLLKENTEEDDVIVVRRPVKEVRQWRFTTDGARVVVDVVTIDIVYLLWVLFYCVFQRMIFADT